ncbi:hypothetical protein [Halioxenophilus sp. WMMB6]|uniref:hypothetical protein n=1 Tax=Halioxenophilus sp. WMMB6 TaxID=3073815 RepID=UPI00295E6B9E|nr:hypothetical protein [Halioxenophilus sp. WMMB6]
MERKNTFVLAAQVAAELYFATKVALQLSLTAKNAHAISARAGQQSAGFRAITSYIEELAENTITYAQAINREAMAVAMLAGQRERATRALTQFHRVQASAADAAFVHTLDAPCRTTAARQQSIDQEFSARLKKLSSQLQDAQQQIRAAAIIASTSKIEATQAGSFQPQLEVIAENITLSSDEIRAHLKTAQQLLNSATENLAKGYH